MSLFLTVGAMAQLDTTKEYLIKYANDDTYMTVVNNAVWSGGATGGINFVALTGNDNQVFTFEESGDGYKLKDRTGHYITCWNWNVGASTTNADEAAVLLFEAASETEYYVKWYNTYKGAEKYFKIEYVSGANNPYGDADKGVAANFAIVEYQDPNLLGAKDALHAEIAEAEAIVACTGTNPGEYAPESTAALVEAIAAAKEVAEGGSTKADDYTAAAVALNAAVEGAVLTPNPVTEGTYMIVSAGQSFGKNKKAITCYAYDRVYGNHGTPGWAPLNENDPLQYWTLEDNKDGSFNIKAAYEGSYINNATNGLGETAKAATFTSLPLAQFNITLAGDSNPLHCNGWNWGGDAAPLTIWAGAENSCSAWKLIRVDNAPSFSHTLTVGDAEWATLMLGFNAEVPAGVTVMTVKSVESNSVILNEYTEGVIAANTAVLVNASAGDYVFKSTGAEATIAESGFEGSLYRKVVTPEGTAYALASVDDNVGLYKAQSTNGTFVNNANKAYFVVAAANGAASYSFRFEGGTTGVENVEVESASNVIYDLTGRKVNAVERGIYIINGKKVLVK